MVLFWRKGKTVVTTVGQGCQLEGTLFAQGKLQVDGTLCGLVTVNGDVTVSETGLIEGPEVRGHDIEVQGVIKAHVYAEGRLTLGATARIEGNVTAGAIDVDPGAYYTGHLSIYDSRTPFYREVHKETNDAGSEAQAAVSSIAGSSTADSPTSERSVSLVR